MRMAVLTGLIMAGLCAETSAEVQLRNAGFEQESFSGWAVRGDGWSIDKKTFSEGAASALCTVGKGDKPEIRACTQTFNGVVKDQIVEVSVDVAGVSVFQPANSKACLAVLCVDAGGNVLKEYRSNVIKPTASFQQVKIDDAIVLPQTEQVYVMLVVEVYRTATDQDWWRFDKVTVAIH